MYSQKLTDGIGVSVAVLSLFHALWVCVDQATGRELSEAGAWPILIVVALFWGSIKGLQAVALETLSQWPWITLLLAHGALLGLTLGLQVPGPLIGLTATLGAISALVALSYAILRGRPLTHDQD